MSQLTLTGGGDSGGGGVSNGLLTALQVYWPGNETSGNLLDAHTNSINLTDINTVTSGTGLVYAKARQYTATNTEYHQVNDNATLSTGDVDFTCAAWVNADSKGVLNGVFSKANATNQFEYYLGYIGAYDRFYFTVSSDGSSGAKNHVYADNLGVPAVSTWYLLLGWHDSAANTINIQVNNGTVDSVAHTLGVFDGTSNIRIGAYYLNCWDGRIGPTMFWKSAAGGGGVLTATQKATLYNSGAGLAYASFTT